MFTGIIEEIGRLRKMERRGQAMVLAIEARMITEDMQLGDSISVNGVCLTVISFDSGSFTVDVMPETYKVTNLRRLSVGSMVNLERAMRAGGRFGGHMVQGHVDSTATIQQRRNDENAVVFTIAPEQRSLMKYVIPKGSITLDGISLTVVGTTESSFTVSIIPHTLKQTILHEKNAGDSVNIECDVLARYIEHMMNFQSDAHQESKGRGSISESFLAEHGY